MPISGYDGQWLSHGGCLEHVSFGRGAEFTVFLKVSMMHRFYRMYRRRFWGDFGAILSGGFTAGRRDGKMMLMRSGPFVPPISFPPLACVVTTAFRNELELSALRGIAEFRGVIKFRIVRIRWEKWNRARELTSKQLPSNEPEDYILRRRHSPEAAVQMGELWELVAARVQLRWRRDSDGTETITVRRSRIANIDFFCVAEDTQPFVSERAKSWLQEHAGEWVSFEEIRVRNS